MRTLNPFKELTLCVEKNSLDLSDVENGHNEKPLSLPVNLTPTAKRVIETLREKTGIPAREAMSRLLEWFGRIDPRFRLAILQRDEEARHLLALDLLKEWSDEGSHPTPPPEPEPPVTGTEPGTSSRRPSGKIDGIRSRAKRESKEPAE